MSNKHVKLTLVKSLIGRLDKHKATIRCLGLRKMGQTVVVEDTPIVRGRINKVSYLLRIEPTSE